MQTAEQAAGMDVASGLEVCLDVIQNEGPAAPAVALEGTAVLEDSDAVASPDRGSHVLSPAVFGRPEQSAALSNVDLPVACALAAPPPDVCVAHPTNSTRPDQRHKPHGHSSSGGRHGHSQVFPAAPRIDAAPCKASCAVADVSTSGGVAGTGADKRRESAARHANLIAMYQGLLHKRVYWYGDFYSDLCFWTKQNHVILGMFFCHRLHPYSRRERLSVWLCCGCASFAVGLLLLRSTGEKRDGASIVSVINGSILAVLHMSLKMLATCPCVQEGSGAHYVSCQWYCEECGCILMACIWCHIWVLLAVCIMFALWVGVPIDHAFQVWAQSQAVAFAFGVVICTLTFCLKWYGLRGPLARVFPGQGGPEGARPKSAYPLGESMPSDPEIFPGGDRCGCSLRNLPTPKPETELERE